MSRSQKIKEKIAQALSEQAQKKAERARAAFKSYAGLPAEIKISQQDINDNWFGAFGAVALEEGYSNEQLYKILTAEEQ